MSILRIIHPDLSGNQTTKLTAALAAAGTAVTAENTTGIVAGDYVVFGNVGDEKTECKLLSAVASTTAATTAAVDFAHSIGAPMTKTHYNQVRIQSASSETGTYSTLATVDIQWDAEHTLYEHTAGASTTWYKFAYYDADDNNITDYSDAIQATGYKVRSLGAMIARIRTILRIKNDYDVITDDEITDMINESHLDLSAERNWPFLESTFTDSTTDSTQTVSLPTTMKPGSLSDINILYSSINYHPKYLPQGEFLRLDISDGLEATQAAIAHYTIIGATVYFYPIPSSTGSSDVTFYGTKVPDTLDEINEQSDYPEVSYFVYDVAHEIATSMGKEIKMLDRLEGRKDRAYARMMKYGTKQSTGPTRVRRNSTTNITDPSIHWTIS